MAKYEFNISLVKREEELDVFCTEKDHPPVRLFSINHTGERPTLKLAEIKEGEILARKVSKHFLSTFRECLFNHVLSKKEINDFKYQFYYEIPGMRAGLSEDEKKDYFSKYG